MKTLFFSLLPLCLPFSLFADESSSPARQQNLWQTLMMIGVALLFFYMILWRPEQKRRKKLQEQKSSMQKGDQVTAMGIVGTLVRIEKETATLKMVDGSKIEVLLGAISDVKPAALSRDGQEGAQKSDSSNA